MEKLSEIKNLKTEPNDLTSMDEEKIPKEILEDSVKQEGYCSSNDEIHIKTEPQEDESEFLVTAVTCFEICPNDIKIETDEPMIKIECDNIENEIVQDPLDVSCQIKVHFETIPPGSSVYKCRFCNITFESNTILQKHLNDLHKHRVINNKKSYTCGVCSKNFDQKWNYDKHYRVHSGEKPYVCSVCEKSFREKSHLNAHMRLHKGMKVRPNQKTYIRKQKVFTCTICNKNFTQSGSLTKHTRLHTGQKPHKCQICSKSFIQRYHLIHHLRVHSGERPYECDQCNKKFKEKSALKVHKRSHDDDRPFKCEFCKQQFLRKVHLENHVNTHFGIKPHVCLICDKKFARKCYLAAHTKKHDGQLEVRR